MKAYLFFLLLCFGLTLMGQSPDSPWKSLPSDAPLPTGQQRLFPAAYRHLQLDTAALKGLLLQAPDESGRLPKNSPVVLPVPLPDGTLAHFRIAAYDMMEREMAASFPEIRTFRGASQENPGYTARFDWTYHGFHALIRSPQGLIFIGPAVEDNRTDYLCYYKKDYPAPALPFICATESKKWQPGPVAEGRMPGDCRFRSYRLAIATTAEYSNFHGGTASDVQSAVVTAINRINEVYERELAIRLILIANNDQLYYFNAATDPYTNDDGGTMLDENQANIDAVIGTAAYDIGHVFSTGGGGIAQLYAPCDGSAKAKGVTGLGSPVGDPFYIDYVAHEIGHQFGANHTQNNDCNRVSSTAMEPGSASTIMGYAGVCAPNVQGQSDDYFHGISLEEIADFVAGAGGTCATALSSANSRPSVTPLMPYTIPADTPFRLTAEASDADGDGLSYCWEQWDNEVGAVMPPAATNAEGPLFRSFPPTSANSRYFLNLPSLLAGTDPDWEELPAVSRDMEFRVTVRDDNSSYGCTSEQNLVVSVDGNAGPFQVSSPNTAVNWAEGATQTVSWDVASTQSAPVNCRAVNIKLSYDGGVSFPVTLADNTPNDGSQPVALPPGTTTAARILVEAVDNLFFDISDVDFAIDGAAAPGFTMIVSPQAQQVCQGNEAFFTAAIGSLAGFSDPVNISVNGLPPGVTASFSTNPVVPNGNTTLTIGSTNNLPAGITNLTIIGMSSSGPQQVLGVVALTALPAPATPALSSPADGAGNQEPRPAFNWAIAANATSYELQVATDNGFTNLSISENILAPPFVPTLFLLPQTTYYWRVRGLSTCGAGAWSGVRELATGPCTGYLATGLPAVISSIGTPTLASNLIITDNGTITDLDVVSLKGSHSWIADLSFELKSPQNTTVPLWSALCGSFDDFDIILDDEAATDVASHPCPMDDGLGYRPTGSLSAFDGQNINGSWTLSLSDDSDLDGGALESWGVRVCVNDFNSMPLPVEWQSFRVEAREKAIYLAWEVASERNNAGFEIQRQVEGDRTFSPIGWIDGRGDNPFGDSYEFTDHMAPMGINCYYRLRQLDYDGEESYSEIRTARLVQSERGLSIWPNPAGSTLELRLPVDEAGLAWIFAADGQLCYQQRLAGGRGTLDIGRLPAGLYVLKVVIGGQAWQQRLVKR